jgi:N,N-dimethylformamidase
MRLNFGMTDATLPITGYLDRFSYRPGDMLTAHVSLRTPGPYRVRLQRLISGDPNPAGPGLRFEDHTARLDLSLTGANHPIPVGSYARIDAAPSAGSTLTVTALICPGRIDRRQVVLDWRDGDTGVTLGIANGGVFGRLRWAGAAAGVTLPEMLVPRVWYRVWLSVDTRSGRIALGCAPLAGGEPALADQTVSRLRLPQGGAILIAAEDPANPSHHFTGKIEAPALLSGFVTAWPKPLFMSSAPVLAAWDFSQDIGGTRVFDTGPHACHGEVVNMPARGMVGANWSGTETCWRHAPADYAAIHFHADDLSDCRWPPSFTFTVPEDLRSGIYLLHLTCAGGEDRIPFWVLPARTAKPAPIVFLASTMTYLAYSNHRRGNLDDAFRERIKAWGAYPHNTDDYPIYQGSTYNRHPDWSGISLASRLRPILTIRPGYLTFNDARGSGLRHFPADTHLLAWLEDKGFAYDVVTDEDLDDEGVALLRPYKLVLTGSHPEYHTLRMIDALEGYKQGGGNLAYLGGNGFYWRIARNPALPHVLEVRRAEGGIRAWDAQPGEYFHQLDGQLGGLWRRSRRPPQMLAGLGFSGQGLFEGTYFRRTPASHQPEFAWMFEGVGTDVIGDYGLSGGGAAGFELDRADFELGTPRNTVILAVSENPPASMTTVPEELLSHISTVNGESPEALKRGEIIWFDTPSGGSVFAAGSITFLGSLWHEGGFQGPVSRLLENVVRRMSG